MTSDLIHEELNSTSRPRKQSTSVIYIAVPAFHNNNQIL
eukprot:XP_001706372.1 Hypothetical protein GL50803_29095 [Giardia lamblia ATCC 50803]